MDDEQGYPYFRKPPNIAWLSFKQYFFCQGSSEDLPHHTARIFSQARVAS